VLAKNHRSNSTFRLETPDWQIFGEKAAILSPEQTEGPYYVTGELIRKDVRDGQQGVKLFLDIQMVDLNTCEPAKDIALDFWHTNATVQTNVPVGASYADIVTGSLWRYTRCKGSHQLTEQNVSRDSSQQREWCSPVHIKFPGALLGTRNSHT
jgi:hypothetical protein